MDVGILALTLPCPDRGIQQEMQIVPRMNTDETRIKTTKRIKGEDAKRIKPRSNSEKAGIPCYH
jgi:hypothetical protein